MQKMWYIQALMVSMVLMYTVGVRAADSVAEQSMKCLHGAVISQPNLCCSPRDGIFRNVTIDGDLTVNGSTIINGDIVISGTIIIDADLINESLVIDGDLIVNGSACFNALRADQEVVDNTTYAPYFSDINTGLLNDSHKEIFSLFEETTTLTSIASVDVVLDDIGSYLVRVDDGTNGSVRVFGRSNNTWQQLQVLTPSIAGRFTRAAISSYGDRIACLIRTNDEAIGVEIFSRINGVWVSEFSMMLGFSLLSSPFFNIALSGDGSRLLIGAAVEMATNNVLYLVRDGTICSVEPSSWHVAQTFSGSGNSYFGAALDISRDGLVALIGSGRGGDNFAGSVDVYTRDPLVEQFSLVQTLTNPSGVASGNSSFGSAVSLSANGDYFIVGDPEYSQAFFLQGAGYIFMRENNQWVEQQLLLCPTASSGDQGFGASVGISADGAVSVIQTSINFAAAKVFVETRSAATWNVVQVIAPVNGISPFNQFALSKDQSFLALINAFNNTTHVYSPGCAVVPTCLELPQGDINNPSLTFIGNTTMGIYSPAADQMNMVTSGTDRIRIDGTGSVTKFSTYKMSYSLSTTAAIAAATVIPFDTEIFDPNNSFSASAYTAPVTGVYLVQVTADIDSTVAQAYSMTLRINGAPLSPAPVQYLLDTITNVQLPLITLVSLAQGDVLDVLATCSDVAGGTISAGALFSVHFMSF